MKLIFSVFIGSGLGGVCRWLLSSWINGLCAARHCNLFPYATLAVNLLGCFLIGLILGIADRGTLSESTKTFLTAGFCGGLTTFSTFSHENYLLFQSNNLPIVLGYSVLSLVLGFGAAYLGHAVVR